MRKVLLALFLLIGLNVHSADTMKQIFEGDSSSKITAVKEFNTTVAMFQMQGYSVIDKFGVNLNISTSSDPEDIWEFGGLYPYDTNGTAPIMYLSSSSGSDTEPITVSGLDIEGNDISQTITLQGQTNLTLTTPLWRVYRLENDGSNNINGIVYCHTDPTPSGGVPLTAAVRAIIDGDHNQTLMAMYTVPKGKVGFLYRGEFGVELEGNTSALAEYAHVHYESRRYGKVFKVKKAITCMVGGGSALYQDPRTFPDIIPALTDIKLTVEEVSQAMGMWGAFDILLVDEDKLSKSLLRNIGQPGY